MSDTRRVDEIVWREDLYPRLKHDPALVQRYADNLDVMPPIEVNQHNELIDGYHRWTAHRKNGKDTIAVTVTPTKSDREVRLLAIRRNRDHGSQLSEADKKHDAIDLYAAGTYLSKEEIAVELSVTLRTVTSYLTDVDRQLREERKQAIFDLWLSCHTQEEIAAAVGVSQPNVAAEIETFINFGSSSNSDKSLALYQDADWKPPLYNVWTFAKKSNEVSHFGNSEQRILDNLLYLYTNPFDIVLDPFAGGGATINVCQRRLRRYWVSDRKPIVEREAEIRTLDIVTDLPALNRNWSEVSLTYLDPPYWKQAEGQYSTDAADLANMSLEEFTSSLAVVVKRISQKQSRGVIAMLMQPTQWRAPDRQFTDHVFQVVQAVVNKHLTVINRVSCPYSTEQCLPQQVEWAKDHKELLVISRELVVWKIA